MYIHFCTTFRNSYPYTSCFSSPRSEKGATQKTEKMKSSEKILSEANKQSKQILIRISSFEKKLLQAKSEEAGMSVSEFLRAAALNKQIKPPPTSEQMEAYMLLKNFLFNFGRISNAFKKKDYADLHREILEVKEEIMKHLKIIENGE